MLPTRSWRTTVPNGFRNYLNSVYGLARRYPVEVHYVGETGRGCANWWRLPHCPDVRKCWLSSIMPDIFKGREKKLMDLQGGVPYNLCWRSFFHCSGGLKSGVEYDLHRIIEERYRRKLTDAEFQEILAGERAAAEADELRLAELRRLEAEKNDSGPSKYVWKKNVPDRHAPGRGTAPPGRSGTAERATFP